MDPHITRSTMGRSVLKSVFDSLLDIDPDMKEYPLLATSWELEDDNTWVFNLREGVRFHNGDRFTAADVKYTVERINDPNMKSFYSQFMKVVKDVEIVNDHKVKLITKKPYSPMLEVLRNIDIVPRAAEKIGAQEFGKNPIGCGPYRHIEWVPNERVLVEGFKNYYRGAPNLEKVNWKPIPDLSTRIVELNTGGTDLITGLAPLDYGRLKKGVCHAEGVLSVYAVFFLINCYNEILAHKQVRQAMNYAVNKDEIIKVFLQGEAAPLNCSITPYHFGYNPDLKPYPYDPDEAKKLLREAGYGNGFEMTLKTTRGRWTKAHEISMAIAGYLGEVGIKTQVVEEEYGQSLQSLFRREKACVIHSFSSSAASTFRQYPPIFVSDPEGVAWKGWKNQRFDELFAKAQVEMDVQKRLALMQETQTIMHEDPPALYVHQPKDIFGVADRVKNWRPRPDAMITVEGVSV
jgi:peptide/nickel transport system substrate-binding protein